MKWGSMKSWQRWLFGLLVLAIPVMAYAGIDNRNMEPTVRNFSSCVTRYEVTTAAPVAGTLGIIATAPANVAAPGTTTFSIATMEYPARIKAHVYDAAVENDADPTCATLTLVGIDHLGFQRREVLTDLEESTSSTITNTVTTYAYSKVLSVSATGCDLSDSADLVVLRPTAYIGLGRDIRATTDVERACLVDASDSSNLKCAYASRPGSNNDLSESVNVRYDYIDASLAQFGGTAVAIADNDQLCWTVRPSW